MALTNFSDVTGIFPETVFNTIIEEVMMQRPSIFNYASKDLIKNNNYCSPINVKPVLKTMGIDLCTEISKIPIPGSNNPNSGLDFCVQLKELKVDFNPTNTITLPPELGSLAIQQFALKGTVCAGLSCGKQLKFIGGLFDSVKSKDAITVPTKIRDRKLPIKNIGIKNIKDIKDFEISTGLNFNPFNQARLSCFCLSFFAKLTIVNENGFLKMKLLGIEIQDITPLGLENSIECYLKHLLDDVVFPKVKLAIQDLSFNVQDYFTIGLTPTSAQVPYNPNVSNDKISVFFNIN
jgi:hypothetical protein